MKTLPNALRGMLVASMFPMIVAAPIAKEAPAKADPARSAALADIQKTLGFIPQFLSDIPARVLPGTWEEMKTLQMSDKTAIPPRYKELVGLGVSSQIPCLYCITAHREFARSAGASPEELGEAVTLAALVRHWSTFINGLQLDEARFRADIMRIADQARKAKAPGAAPSKPTVPIEVVDGKTALQDISQTFGFVPEFLQKFPDVARAGAWKTFRDMEMNPNTSIPGKYKSLISLGVSAQVPCSYCIMADMEFARVEGATEAEIGEALAMAGFTRYMSTLLNGMKVDEGRFNSDVARLVKDAQAARPMPKDVPVRTR